MMEELLARVLLEAAVVVAGMAIAQLLRWLVERPARAAIAETSASG